MPKYFYTAQSSKGERKTGVLEARDQQELAKELKSQGFVLISAGLDADKRKKKINMSVSIPFLDNVSLQEKLMFVRNLQVMVAAGISLPRALRTLASQTKSKKLKKALLQISQDITKGNDFSGGLAKYPKIFPELFSSMVKVGEEAGTLEDVLGVLARQMEREYDLRSKITGALIYPAVIIFAMIGIGVLMLIVVVPKLSETFDELGVELPLATRLVIGTGNFLAEFWYLLPLIFLALFVLLRIALKSKAGKKIADRGLLMFPVISSLIKGANSAFFTRTLSSLVASGVPIVRSLEITAATLSNFYFKEAVQQAGQKVRKGAKLSESLEPYQNVFSSLVIQMIQVGEETGETSGILAKLADFYEQEVGNTTKNLAAVVEPALMILIGGVVGFFAISMIQPMYSMLGSL